MEADIDQHFDCVCYKWFMPYAQYKETAFPAVFGITLSVVVSYICKFGTTLPHLETYS